MEDQETVKQGSHLVKHPDSGRHVLDPVEAGEGGETGEGGQVGGDEGLGPGDVQLCEGEAGVGGGLVMRLTVLDHLL